MTVIYTTQGGFSPGIHVYGLNGSGLVGIITLIAEEAPRSRGIGFGGSWQFVVPTVQQDGTPNPELAYLHKDNFIVCGNKAGNRPWAGPISQVEKSDGIWRVTADDLFSVLDIPIVKALRNLTTQTRVVHMPAQGPDRPAWSYEEDITPKQGVVVTMGDKATDVVKKVMEYAEWAGVRWDVDLLGDNTIFGDQQLTGTVMAGLQTIAGAAFCQFWWEVRLNANGFTPVLVWRPDDWASGGGVDLHDGPGGQIGVASSLLESSSEIVNAVRIYGQVTTIAEHVPPWAKVLGIREVYPVAEVWAPTNGYRRRARLDESASLTMANVHTTWTVEATLPTPVQEEAGKAQADKYKKLYADFIHAVHDTLGRPWHDGWSWAGPDDKLTRVWYKYQLVKAMQGERVVVARGEAGEVVVHYDRVEGKQTTTRAKTEEGSDYNTGTVLEWEWDKMDQWDPFRDGTGGPGLTEKAPGDETSGWRIQRYTDGDKDASSTLVYGVSPSATLLTVASLMEFPGTFPYTISVGAHEQCRVFAQVGYQGLVVGRGINGTTPVIHEAGETVSYKAAGAAPTYDKQPWEDEQKDDEAPPETKRSYIPWPEGEAYGRQLLRRLNRETKRFSLLAANVGTLWADLAVGQTHRLLLRKQYSGWDYDGTVRIMGWAVNEAMGIVELAVEDWGW